MTTTDAMEEIRNKLQDTLLKGLGKAEDYGLFFADKDDSKKGFWLDPVRTLEYYQFENRVCYNDKYFYALAYFFDIALIQNILNLIFNIKF